MWKGKLDRMVANLNAEGAEDTPYNDKLWENNKNRGGTFMYLHGFYSVAI